MFYIYDEIPELLQFLPRELWLVIQKQLFTNNLYTITDKLRFPRYRNYLTTSRGRIHMYTLSVNGCYRFVRYAYPAAAYDVMNDYEDDYARYGKYRGIKCILI